MNDNHAIIDDIKKELEYLHQELDINTRINAKEETAKISLMNTQNNKEKDSFPIQKSIYWINQNPRALYFAQEEYFKKHEHELKLINEKVTE